MIDTMTERYLILIKTVIIIIIISAVSGIQVDPGKGGRAWIGDDGEEEGCC